MPGDKILPYEEALRVPTVISLGQHLRPPSGVLLTSAAPTANIDVVATLLELARARPFRSPGACRTLDGRSLAPILRGERGAWPVDRGVLLELEGPRARRPFLPCTYEGIRAGRRMLVEHRAATGANTEGCRPESERELYDLRRDPFQLAGRDPLPPNGHDCE